MDLPAGTPVRLNIGAGEKVLDGWISVGLDAHHAIRTDVRTLPLGDATVDEAMAIHVLEHLWRWEAPAALAEWHRVLKPGALLVLEQPELERCCRAVLAGAAPRGGLWGLFGDPGYRTELMAHKWCWSEKELIGELKEVGFTRVRVKPLQYHGRRADRDIRIEARK